MKSFIESYFSFTKRLLRLSKEGKIFPEISPLLFLENYGISETDEALLAQFFRTKKGYFDGSTDGEGVRALSFPEALDMSYPNKFKLLTRIDLYIKQTSGELKNVLLNLYYVISDNLETLENIRSTPLDKDPVISQSLVLPFVEKEITLPEKKLYRLRQYNFNLAKDPEYFPTEKVSIDTSKFSSLSREELQEYFSPEVFYTFSKQEIHSLLQTAASEYLTSFGIEPCAVVFEPLKTSSKSIQFGEYDPNRGVIVINSALLEKLDEFKEEGNAFLPYQLLSTTIHESRHRVQFSYLNKETSDPKMNAIKSDLMVPQENLTYSQYLASADELDARNSALEYIKELAETSNNENLMAFYNLQKRLEDKNAKQEVNVPLKVNFPCIYTPFMFDTSLSLDIYRNSFFSSMSETSSEPSF